MRGIIPASDVTDTDCMNKWGSACRATGQLQKAQPKKNETNSVCR